MNEKNKNNILESMNEEEMEKFVSDNIWKVRPCNEYLAEYTECKSISMKFQNWFVNGELGSCDDWKEDYKNCTKPYNNYKAHASIIKHEDERLERRLKNHLANDVWEKRDSPPENWNAELPDFLKEKQKNTFLPDSDTHNSCIIF